MRARRIAGVKRVTILGHDLSVRSGAASDRDSGATEKVKFSIIEPSGLVERGAMRVDLGAVKKERRALKPIERRLRRLVRAQHRALGRYLVLHDRSRRRRRSGWAGDLRKNLSKVIRRGL